MVTDIIPVEPKLSDAIQCMPFAFPILGYNCHIQRVSVQFQPYYILLNDNTSPVLYKIVPLNYILLTRNLNNALWCQNGNMWHCKHIFHCLHVHTLQGVNKLHVKRKQPLFFIYCQSTTKWMSKTFTYFLSHLVKFTNSTCIKNSGIRDLIVLRSNNPKFPV